MERVDFEDICWIQFKFFGFAPKYFPLDILFLLKH